MCGCRPITKYSTENQLDIIRNYATARGLQILRVFEDSGRSGLRLDGREALQNLMAGPNQPSGFQGHSGL
ncbi:recombinase family protein [Roseicyclus sp.]|uniref:recombinase family protein n=1 Tax=Roseicyclus sp. TaxID=1914329 RepID=UPI00262D0E2F|nr:recombinase family protein [Roseicyclus sp.]